MEFSSVLINHVDLYKKYWRVLYIRVDNLTQGKLFVVSILYGEPSNHHFSVSQFNTHLKKKKKKNNNNNDDNDNDDDGDNDDDNDDNDDDNNDGDDGDDNSNNNNKSRFISVNSVISQ